MSSGLDAMTERARSDLLRRAVRISLYAAAPALSAISPLIAIPAVTSEFASSGWAAVAIAQSLGSAAGVVAELGWGLNGPQRVAQAGIKSRSRLYALALVTKSMVGLSLLLPLVGVIFLLVPEFQFAGILVAVGYMMSALSPAWFLIGSSTPGKIIYVDVLPRVASSACAAVLITWFGAPLAIYGMMLIIGAAIPPLIIAWQRKQGFAILGEYGWRRYKLVFLSQWAALRGRAASAAYIALPISLVAVAAPASVVTFSGAERLMRMFLAVLASVPNSMQAWVGKRRGAVAKRRTLRTAVIVNSCVGMAAGILFTALAPVGADFVFSGEVSVSYSLSGMCGLVVWITCTSRATGGLALVAYRRVGTLANSALVGASLGVPLILTLAHAFGAAGAFLGEIVCESVVLLYQLAGLRTALREQPSVNAVAPRRMPLMRLRGRG